MSSQTPTVVARSAVVESFYTAVSDGDPESIGVVIDQHFADDASIEWPVSLSYGGRVEGARRLRKMFVAMAGSDVKVGPADLHIARVIATHDAVVAELSFDWYPPGASEPVPSAALELWTFDGGKVTSIRAFYWDTAALAAATTTGPSAAE